MTMFCSRLVFCLPSRVVPYLLCYERDPVGILQASCKLVHKSVPRLLSCARDPVGILYSSCAQETYKRVQENGLLSCAGNPASVLQTSCRRPVDVLQASCIPPAGVLYSSCAQETYKTGHRRVTGQLQDMIPRRPARDALSHSESMAKISPQIGRAHV